MKKEINYLRNELRNNKLVVFVGAGVSANYGLPNWDSLTKLFAEKLEIYEKDETGNKTLKSKFTADEYIRFPLYYLTKFGTDQYWRLLNTALTPKVENKNSYDLYNKLLFQIKPQHIITTNFDNIIDIENDKLIYKYGVIKRDVDLAKTNKNNFIVKMHGDLEEENIVLNENDYLEYSHNFMLIENFVKSLLATHTLLFIGFSYSDPNFKKIHHWVQSILKKNSRKAYFFSTKNDGFDEYEIEYFTENHIVLINCVDLLGSEPLKQDEGERLYNMLSLLENDFISELHDRLIKYKNFNYIPKIDIINEITDFPHDLIQYQSSYLLIKDKDTVDFLSKSAYNSEEYDIVTDILSKAGFDGFYKYSAGPHDRPKQFKLFDKTTYNDELFALYSDFEYFKISNKLEKLGPDTDIIIREKAFYYFELGLYRKSLDYYDKLLLNSYKNKNIFELIIFERFREKLHFFLKDDKPNSNESNFENINMDKLINQLPNRYTKQAVALSNKMNNFCNYYHERLLAIRISLERDKNILENNGRTNQENFKDLSIIADALMLYMYRNFLPFDMDYQVSSIFTNIFDLVMYSYNTKISYKKRIESIWGPMKINFLTYNYIYIAVNYLQYNEVVDIFEKHHTEHNIKIKSTTPDDLLSNVDNIINYINYYNDSNLKYSGKQYIYSLYNKAFNLFYITSYCKLTKSQYSKFFLKINVALKSMPFSLMTKYLNPILDNFTPANEIAKEDLVILLKTILTSTTCYNFISFCDFFNNLFNKIHLINPMFKLKKFKRFSLLLRDAEEIIHKDINRHNHLRLLYCLTNAYQVCNRGLRFDIRELLLRIVPLHLKITPKRIIIEIIYNMIQYEIINRNKIMEIVVEYIEYCKNYIISKAGKSISEQQIAIDYLYSTFKILELNINEYQLNSIRDISPFFDCFFFRLETPFSKFKPKWIVHLLKYKNSKKELKELLISQNYSENTFIQLIHDAMIEENDKLIRQKYSAILKLLD